MRAAHDASLTPVSADTKGFWFFSPQDVDVVVKVIDARGLNGRFWVFVGSLTSEAYTVTVTDTLTGASKTHTNAAGQTASQADTNAF